MTLWALNSFPSAESMTSVRPPFCLNCPTDSTNWKAWLGQSIMVAAYSMQFDGKYSQSFLVHTTATLVIIQFVFFFTSNPLGTEKMQYYNVSLSWELWHCCFMRPLKALLGAQRRNFKCLQEYAHIPYTHPLYVPSSFFFPQKSFWGSSSFLSAMHWDCLSYILTLFRWHIGMWSKYVRVDVLQVFSFSLLHTWLYLSHIYVWTPSRRKCITSMCQVVLYLNHISCSNKFPGHSIACISICRICVFVKVYQPFVDGT